MIEINTENFKGPMDLLLRTIENKELDITQINLANVADQYLEYVNNSSHIKPGELGDFLFVAAKLLYIKSRVLLPFLKDDEEEAEEAEELEARLKIYKEFGVACDRLEKVVQANRFMFACRADKRSIVEQKRSFNPPRDLDKDKMRGIFMEVVGRVKKEEILKEKLEEKKVDHSISLEEKIGHIRSIIKEARSFDFNPGSFGKSKRTELVVSFLAILELVKQKEINAEQAGIFSSISIRNI